MTLEEFDEIEDFVKKAMDECLELRKYDTVDKILDIITDGGISKADYDYYRGVVDENTSEPGEAGRYRVESSGKRP